MEKTPKKKNMTANVKNNSVPDATSLPITPEGEFFLMILSHT